MLSLISITRASWWISLRVSRERINLLHLWYKRLSKGKISKSATRYKVNPLSASLITMLSKQISWSKSSRDKCSHRWINRTNLIRSGRKLIEIMFCDNSTPSCKRRSVNFSMATSSRTIKLRQLSRGMPLQQLEWKKSGVTRIRSLPKKSKICPAVNHTDLQNNGVFPE